MKNIYVLALLCLNLSSFSQNKKYFQQKVDYQIEVKLDDKNHILRAFETINYQNNSSDTLHFIWFHLWPNAYKNNQTALAKQLLYDHGSTKLYFSSHDERGFIDSLNFKTKNQVLTWQFHPEHIDIAKVFLPNPLLPGQEISITTPFKVKIPVGHFSRLGHINQQYQITQWYPKPAVYDINGWHPMPYLSQGEFYSEFGQFQVKITLPENYVIGATGDVQEASEIYFLDSLARKTAQIDSFNLSDNSFPESSSTLKTVTYIQNNIHDFAWFADKRYHVLTGMVMLPHSGEKVKTYVMFTNQHPYLWKNAIEYMNDAIHYYSLWNGDYPYKQATAVDGALSAGGGMEYPNVTVIGSVNSAAALEQVIMHEVGHNWFYGILGSNERIHPWLDEGLNTYNELRYLKTKYPDANFLGDTIQLLLLKTLGVGKADMIDLNHLGYLYTQSMNTDQPISSSSTSLSKINYGTISYFKTGILFYYLQKVYGEEQFTKAMQHYFNTWKFKHPQPTDLKTCLEQSLGENLDWVFTGIIPSKAPLDLKLKKIETSGTQPKVLIKNKGLPMAGLISYTSITGKSEILATQVIENQLWVNLPVGAQNIQLESKYLPDINRRNNQKNFYNQLQVNFLAKAGYNNKRPINYLPFIGWNNYNKWMPGIALYNGTIPIKKFEYLLAPMINTSNYKPGSLVGIAEIKYHVNAKTNYSRLTTALKFRKFYTTTPPNYYHGNFNSSELSLTYKLNDAPNKNQLQNIFIVGQMVNENLYALKESTSNNIHNKNLFVRFGYRFSKDRTINKYQALAEIELFELFFKADVTTIYKHMYSKKGYFDVRFFAGKFFSNSSANPRFNYQMDGQTGLTDYRYSQIFMNRGEASGIFAQQYLNNHGNFKVPVPMGQSSNWLSALNFSIKPPIKLPIKAFTDFGLSPGITTPIEFYYDAGLSFVLIKEICEIHLPLVYSQNIKTYLNTFNIGFAETIRFTLNLNLANPLEIREKISF